MKTQQRCTTCDGPPIQRDTDGDFIWKRHPDAPGDLYCSNACREIADILGVGAAHLLATGFFATRPRYVLG